jgi:hypothetical protein
MPLLYQYTSRASIYAACKTIRTGCQSHLLLCVSSTPPALNLFQSSFCAFSLFTTGRLHLFVDNWLVPISTVRTGQLGVSAFANSNTSKEPKVGLAAAHTGLQWQRQQQRTVTGTSITVEMAGGSGATPLLLDTLS